jgi:hypothetical protein
LLKNVSIKALNNGTQVSVESKVFLPAASNLALRDNKDNLLKTEEGSLITYFSGD